MTANALLARLGIQHPIIAAPMGGGPSTPELVAAVSNAGGMGSIAGAYLAPGQIADEIGRVRALTGRPFAVNLFAGGYHAGIGSDPAPMLARMAEFHEELGLAAPELPAVPPDPFEAQLQVVLDTRPAAFSFTFGIPSAGALERLRAAGIAVMGTATTVEEGRMLAEAGVDAVVAQGAEAGAHRGTFAGDFDASMVPTLELTAGIAAATAVPVIASGGLMDGRDVAAALRAGAQAVQLGTAFIPCPESGAAEVYKQAILSAVDDRTVITRAFSGRHARGSRTPSSGGWRRTGATSSPSPRRTRSRGRCARRLGSAVSPATCRSGPAPAPPAPATSPPPTSSARWWTSCGMPAHPRRRDIGKPPSE